MNIKTITTSVILLPLLLLSGCGSSSFSSWKKDGTINSIKAYIDDVCNKNSKNYIPEEYRISTWDIDGTGILERNLNNNDLLPQDQVFEYTYKKYRSDVSSIKTAYDSYIEARNLYWEDETNAIATALFRAAEVNYYNEVVNGLTPEQASIYFDDAVKNGNYTTEKKLMDIAYKPMKEMYSYLKQNNFQVYFVSGTFRFILYSIASNLFGDIDFQHCIGTDVDFDYTVEEGKSKLTFSTMKDPVLHDEKVKKIVTEIGKTPVLVFGNSTGDLEMLQYTITNSSYKSLGVVINHDDDVREYKYNYEKVHQMCQTIGALEVSMKNEFVNVF